MTTPDKERRISVESIKQPVFRPVTEDDALLLLEWRNDPETLRQSGTTTPVEREGHIKWLSASLKNPKRILMIAEIGGVAIGTVRADERDDGFTEISYTIAPTERGKGLSKPMVVAFVKQYLSGRKILAEIKESNPASESVARALGLAPFHREPSKDSNDSRPMVEWR
jgi:RimJ/RimL family protein N-acetyltransferase